MNRFQDLLRRIDEALTEASAAGGDALKMADLAAAPRRTRARAGLGRGGVARTVGAGRGAVKTWPIICEE